MGKKKKEAYDVGILSYNLYTSNNYGAVLHSWAFQQYLDKMGVSNVIVDYRPPQRPVISLFKLLRKKGLAFVIRKFKFNEFFKKHYRKTRHTYTYESLIDLDFINRFVCETDVTWSYSKHYGFDKGFFCDFKNMKYKDNVAYSVDFGSNFFIPEAEEEFKYLTKNFKYISVRNLYKIDYAKRLTGRDDICVVTDPVFLLDKEDYKPIIKPAKRRKKYVLVYNCVENNLDLKTKAKEFAQKNNLDVMELSLFRKNKLIKNKILTASIEEFLGLIDGAEYVFTNSYHGLCFSILFNKQFYAFARIGNSEKIQSLLDIYGLKERLYSEENGLSPEKIDYKVVNKRIKLVGDESKAFVKHAIVDNQPTLV